MTFAGDEITALSRTQALKHLQIGTEFAHGSFGRLYSATDVHGYSYCIKVETVDATVDGPDDDTQSSRAVICEHTIAQRMSAIGVGAEVEARGEIRAPHLYRTFYLLMRKYPYTLMTAPKDLQALAAESMARAVARMHDEGYYHGDVKASNVVVAHDGTARLIDFGFARRMRNSEAYGMNSAMFYADGARGNCIQQKAFASALRAYCDQARVDETTLGKLSGHQTDIVGVAAMYILYRAQNPKTRTPHGRDSPQ